MVMEQIVGGQGTSNKENEDPNENGDGFHMNNSYEPSYVDIENISTQIQGVCLFVIGQSKYWIVYIVHYAFNNDTLKHRLIQQEKGCSN
jgi:hypothetical protein